MTSGGRLARVDVADNDDVNVKLFLSHLRYRRLNSGSEKPVMVKDLKSLTRILSQCTTKFSHVSSTTTSRTYKMNYVYLKFKIINAKRANH